MTVDRAARLADLIAATPYMRFLGMDAELAGDEVPNCV